MIKNKIAKGQRLSKESVVQFAHIQSLSYGTSMFGCVLVYLQQDTCKLLTERAETCSKAFKHFCRKFQIVGKAA